jgi:hypothetical protein
MPAPTSTRPVVRVISVPAATPGNYAPGTVLADGFDNVAEVMPDGTRRVPVTAGQRVAEFTGRILPDLDPWTEKDYADNDIMRALGPLMALADALPALLEISMDRLVGRFGNGNRHWTERAERIAEARQGIAVFMATVDEVLDDAEWARGADSRSLRGRSRSRPAQAHDRLLARSHRPVGGEN